MQLTGQGRITLGGEEPLTRLAEMTKRDAAERYGAMRRGSHGGTT